MNNPNSLKQAKNQQKTKKSQKPKQQAANRVAVVNQQKEVRIGRPTMTQSSSGDGSIRVRHREYLADVAGSVLFACTSFPINPGLVSTFPWGNTIFNQYESYTIQNIRFEFETMKSTATNGSILMVVDYDASDAVPTSKQQLMNFNRATRSPVWSECIFSASFTELHKLGPSRYMRSTVLAPNLDIKTYDVGNFLIATQGCADTSAIGELYVSYDVVAQTPVLDGAAAGSLNNFSYLYETNAATRAAPYSSPNLAIIVGGLNLSYATNVITFNTAGTYILDFFTVGTAITAAPALGGTATSNVVINFPIVINTGSTQSSFRVYVVAGNSQTLITDFSGACTTLGAINFLVNYISPALGPSI